MTTTDRKRDGYRPSASLILAGKETTAGKADFDYSLLLIKRSEHTAYALNHCVFPGGVFDPKADESINWLTYFHNCGVTTAQLDLVKTQQSQNRPDLLSQGQSFTRDISLRLTALRETFEEVGILLCRPISSLKELEIGQTAHVQLSSFDRELWQERVHNDAQQFLDLCRHLEVIPDIWALSEWSVWRTPASASRKYDTVYYFAALDTVNVSLLLEPNEVISAHWLHPEDCWRQTREAIIWLPFILLYETARLMNMRRWEHLMKFARQRSSRGSTLLQPIYYRCDGALLGVLPGDELYLGQPHTYKESIMLSDSIDDVNKRAKRYHRYVIYGFQRVDFACNLVPLDGHLPLQNGVNTRLSKL